jgi:hypothetical protein
MHAGQPFEEILEACIRFVAVALAALNKCADHGAALTGVFTSDEEPVLLSNRDGTDRVFDLIAVDLDLAFALLNLKRKTEPQMDAD